MLVEVPVRSLVLIVMLAAVACADDPKPPPAPPRVYALEELAWAHPAMGVMVERMAKHVAERHPEWVWLPPMRMRRHSSISFGWCASLSKYTTSPQSEQRDCDSDGGSLWFNVGPIDTGTEALRPMQQVSMGYDDRSTAGWNPSLHLTLWTPDLQYHDHGATLRVYRDPQTAGARATMATLFNWDRATTWPEVQAIADAQSAPWPGLDSACYRGLNLIDAALSGAVQMQQLGLSYHRSDRDLAHPAGTFRATSDPHAFIDAYKTLGCPPGESYCVDMPLETLMRYRDEAVWMEERVWIRAQLSVLQTESATVYASLADTLPLDLVRQMREANGPVTPR